MKDLKTQPPASFRPGPASVVCAMLLTLGSTMSAVQAAPPEAHQGEAKSHHAAFGAERHHGMRGQRHARRSHFMFKGLGLSESQRDEIFEIRHAMARDLRQHRKAIRGARKEMRSMVQKNKFETSNAQLLADKIGQASAQLALLRASMMHKITAVLTPEQRTKLQSKRHGKPMNGRRKHG